MGGARELMRLIGTPDGQAQLCAHSLMEVDRRAIFEARYAGKAYSSSSSGGISVLTAQTAENAAIAGARAAQARWCWEDSGRAPCSRLQSVASGICRRHAWPFLRDCSPRTDRLVPGATHSTP